MTNQSSEGPIIPVIRRWRQGIPRASRLARLAEFMNSGFRRDPASVCESYRRKHLPLTSGLHMHTHTCEHT